ncbi:MAG TPA: hypothetical protein VKY27_04085 [Bacteriovoracaceae bacterium]|nr:hypothetical protein [Bacteriovoracaceae bacterium]
MKYIALIHNWFLDFDFFWWPFSILKPLPHQLITWNKVMKMSLCFGILIWAFISVYYTMQMGFNFEFLIVNFIGSIAGFFLWFGLITKPLWNYRAKRLKK